MDVFDRMLELEPIMMLHTGNFTYPSYQINQDYPRIMHVHRNPGNAGIMKTA